MRLLFDEDFNHRIIRGLVRRVPDLDYTTVQELQLREARDAAVLEAAADDQRLLLSQDASSMTAAFLQRRAAGLRNAGLVIVRQALPIGQAIDELELICRASSNEEWVGLLEFLPLRP